MTATTGRADARSRIVDVAARLLQQSGPAAVTTRGVAQEAGVQAPAIYRLFGDKDGLLEAVAEHVMATYVATKAAAVEAAQADNVDPVEELRRGWRQQIDFALANPALFRLLSDPERVARSPAARAGKQVLADRIRRVAGAGLLKIGEPRAVAIVQSAGIGAIQTLLSTPPESRDHELPAVMLDAVLAHILIDAPRPASVGPLPAVVALRAVVAELDELSEAEQQLLGEWLDRVSTAR